MFSSSWWRGLLGRKPAPLTFSRRKQSRPQRPGVRPALEALESRLAPSADHFLLSGYPAATTAGASQNFTVKALNPDNTVDAGYTGAVHFTSSDAQAVLPADTTFVAGDGGTHAFSATL